MNSLDKLLYLRGISAEYYSYSGDLVPVPWEDRLHFLRETGVDPADEGAIEAAVFKLDAEPWLSWLQPVHIVTKGSSEHVDIRVCPDQYDQIFQWRITTEAGDVVENSFIPVELPEVGDYSIESVRYSARRLILDNLPLGYHRISLESHQQQQETLLIVAPDSCFTGEPDNRKVWGLNCQIYTLRSARNWGIGDFSDLLELVELAATAGMDLISLNPVHAPYTTELDIASPYSPSDRRFLNPLYIDPEMVLDFSESKAKAHSSKGAFQRALSGLRELALIDYVAVATLKYSIYDLMFQYFVESHIEKNSERANHFHNHVKRHGEALMEFAQFESEHCGFRTQSVADPRFHQYLQWLADQQLCRCQKAAKSAGMRIGLMRDLAVGAVRKGAEVQGNPGLYCRNATIGAPPDPLAEQGQNWNLPALDPVALKESGYRLFIDLLHANMQSCGGLRVDHILGLLRLWWCHPQIKNGAYVYYPMDDLLAILCLESQRHHCLIVGEDMGTVPDELRAAMKLKSIYSNKVFYFEKDQDQKFSQPQSHQSDALLMVTNHDVPTLAGWWGCIDLHLRKEIGLMNSEQECATALEQRNKDKQALLNWLQLQNLLPESWGRTSVGDQSEIQIDQSMENRVDKPFDFELCSAIIKANARSRSSMMLFQLDDLQLLPNPINIPGTYKQYPNWRRKQKQTTQAIFGDLKIQYLLSSIDREDCNVTA